MLFGKGVLSDQLHDFSQLFFFLQDFLDLNLEFHEVRVVLVEVFFEHSVVVRIRDVPVDGREMLSLG